MQIVIEISEELYEAYKGRPPMLGDEGMDMIAQAIANGTPLPKGHGRLIDADKVRADMWVLDDSDVREAQNIIDGAPTVIEATEGEG